jgi:hypothetical protein
VKLGRHLADARRRGEKFEDVWSATVASALRGLDLEEKRE